MQLSMDDLSDALELSSDASRKLADPDSLGLDEIDEVKSRNYFRGLVCLILHRLLVRPLQILILLNVGDCPSANWSVQQRGRRFGPSQPYASLALKTLP